MDLFFFFLFLFFFWSICIIRFWFPFFCFFFFFRRCGYERKFRGKKEKKNSNYRLIVVFVFSLLRFLLSFDIRFRDGFLRIFFFPHVCLIIFRILEICCITCSCNFIKFEEICGFKIFFEQIMKHKDYFTYIFIYLFRHFNNFIAIFNIDYKKIYKTLIGQCKNWYTWPDMKVSK